MPPNSSYKKTKTIPFWVIQSLRLCHKTEDPPKRSVNVYQSILRKIAGNRNPNQHNRDNPKSGSFFSKNFCTQMHFVPNRENNIISLTNFNAQFFIH